MLAMGGLFIHGLRSYVIELSDERLSHSLTAFAHSFNKMNNDEPHPRLLGAQGPDALRAFTGQAEGTLIAVVHDGKVAGSAVFSDDEPQAAGDGTTASLESLPEHGGRPFTADVAGLGEYRLQSLTINSNDRLISGISLDRANRALARKTASTVALVLVALLLAGVGTRIAIRYALAPLRRVAATAASVARLPLADPGHRITARVPASDTDIDTDIGVVGHTLNRLLTKVDSALAERAESDRRIRQMLTDASHELRTPLAAIMGYAELTRQDSADLPATTERALGRIEAESRRMTALVDDLLLLSRVDERQDLRAEDVDLSAVLANAISDITVSAPRYQWKSELPETPIYVRGDIDRLHQLITNLLANVATHTPEGTSVIASLALTSDGAQLTIADDGPGIPAELLPRLFERFVHSSSARPHGQATSGLGLAIVQSITDAHNGSISVESNSSGTTFTVLLPAVNHGDHGGQQARRQPGVL